MSSPKTIPLPSSLHSAINATMQAVGYVQKTGTASIGGSYRYASDADLLAGLRPDMVQNGLTLLPVSIHRLDTQHFDTNKGGKQMRCDVVVDYLLTHAPSGESVVIQAIGTGVDSGDKAPYKAMTGALKYALRQGFLIETGNDPEADPKHEDPGPRENSAHAPQDAPGPAAEPAPEPEAPRWTALEQKAFCAALSDMGIDYQDFAEVTEGKLWGRPSGWSAEQRKKTLASLKAKSGSIWTVWNAYLDSRSPNTGREPGQEG
jgi:hypothetical protein